MYWLPVILVLPYIFFIIIIWRSLIKIKPQDSIISSDLFVSVVIPCRNEEENITFLLNDIASQDYKPSLFEVIVVDDNSSDSTYLTAAGFKDISHFSVIKNSGTGKKQAIRTGISNSSGTVIITTDADCRVNSGWLRGICSFFDQHSPDLLICPVQLESSRGFFGSFQELEFLSLQGITAGTAMAGHPVMCNGANLAFKKKAWLKHSGSLHDEIQSGDDIFFLHSLKKDPGSKIMWFQSSLSIATTSPSKNLKEFIGQRKRWLSKGRAYSDPDTIMLAIVTFVTNFILAFLFAAAFFSRQFLLSVSAVFLLKSITDLFILYVTSNRYRKKPLLKWFLPSEILYPFYVLYIGMISLPFSHRQKS